MSLSLGGREASLDVSTLQALLRLHCQPRCITSYFTLSHAADILPQVNWLILGTKLPGGVVPDHPIDLRLWLLGQLNYLNGSGMQWTEQARVYRVNARLTLEPFPPEAGPSRTRSSQHAPSIIFARLFVRCCVHTVSISGYSV